MSKILFGVLLVLLVSTLGQGQVSDDDDFDAGSDDFAEFDVDDEEGVRLKPDQKQAESRGPEVQQSHDAEVDIEDEEDEAVVEDDESDFNHFEDEEEFEGYRQDEEDDEFEHQPKSEKKSSSSPPPPPPKTINIAKIPAHLRTNWENYYLEILMFAGIVVYFLNFFNGKTKNQRMANAWFTAHKSMLESQFALVGDDGAKNVDDVETQLQKDSEHLFTLWCSGRSCCEGMLVELKLLKRQDLVSTISNMMKPQNDQVRIKVSMNPDDMDTFVFCLANKKSAAKMTKEMADLTTFCPEKRPAPEKYGIPNSFFVMSEIPEVTAAMLDSKMVAILNKYPEAVDSIHFSDQYTGPKPSDDQAQQDLPEGKKVLIFTFNMPTIKGGSQSCEEAMEAMKPLMLLVFYFMDKVKRFRLTREAKVKAEKNRSKVKEAFWKSIHAAKAEKAQEERERKRREIKEKIRDIEDPDKQRKLEERELRRERKKAAPKMKQLKVKAM